MIEDFFKYIFDKGKKITDDWAFTPSPADQICGRVYYIICTVADVVQSASKVAFALLTTTIAILFLGQSTVCNQWDIYAYKDVEFSVNMLVLSLRGIWDPIGAYKAKIEAHLDRSNFLNFREQNKVTVLDKVGNKILLTGKGIITVTNIVMSFIRYASASLLYRVSCERSGMMRVVATGADVSLHNAIELSKGCFKAIVYC